MTTYCDGSYPAILNINDDCLRYIFEFLNFFDAVNLAATCERLLNFAKAAVFPMKAKKIKINNCERSKNSVCLYAAPFDNCFCDLKLNRLETMFSYVGDAVETLTIHYFRLRTSDQKEKLKRCFKSVMHHCQYINTLKFNNCTFYAETHKLLKQIESFQFLTELSFYNCAGVTINWPATLKKTSKVEKLSFKTFDGEIGVNFFKYFNNLVSLTIPISHTGRAGDFEMTFDPIRNCLEHLTFFGASEIEHRDYQYIANWIANLPKLKSLNCQGYFSFSLQHLFQSPHLKCLHILFAINNLNLLWRTLSDIGSIEELKIDGGQLTDEESKNAAPLIFNRLQTFAMYRWSIFKPPMSSFLKTVKMPAIHSFELNEIESEEYHDLLAFLKSNITLKSIKLTFKKPEYKNFEIFMLQIIGIFKEHSTPARPFVNMKIYPVKFYKKKMKVLKLHGLKIEVFAADDYLEYGNFLLFGHECTEAYAPYEQIDGEGFNLFG